jgi:hypothetical protein
MSAVELGSASLDGAGKLTEIALQAKTIGDSWTNGPSIGLHSRWNSPLRKESLVHRRSLNSGGTCGTRKDKSSGWLPE